MVDGKIFSKKLSKALRSGGSDAIRIPIESSVCDQMDKFTPSQVGSVVFTIVRNSIVLKMEHIVALKIGVSSVLIDDDRV